MAVFYATFVPNSSLADNYVRFTAFDGDEAREKLYSVYGSSWVACLRAEEFPSLTAWIQGALDEVPFGTLNELQQAREEQ